MMRRHKLRCPSRPCGSSANLRSQDGFSLAEFLISSVILLLLAAAVFSLLAKVQRTTSYQTEVQSVLDNTRLAMNTTSRFLRQAGNDPLSIGFEGLTVTSSSEVNIRSDITGSAAPGNPDKGDPDGDTNDSGENVTIRYNSSARTIELVPDGGSAQTIAGNISAFTMAFFDAAGASTSTGSAARRVTVTITGASALADPETGRIFSMQLSSDVQIATRR